MEETKATILVVEDEAPIALSEAAQLEAAGYGVFRASSGEASVQILKDRPGKIDLVLMDVDLGHGMSGAEAGKAILHIRDIPIVFLYMPGTVELIRETMDVAGYGYALKGSPIDVLDASVKTALRLFKSKN